MTPEANQPWNSGHQGLGGLENAKPFPCPQCVRSYGSKSALNRHLREECGMPRQHICYLCSSAFSQRCNLHRHVSTVHARDSKPPNL
ncbi:transcription factor che-1-like isoform X2 [Fopius arisanus]|uniref:Transcription factor che-1-like isoform X2 n=1 Tax=Fopius arisanus TaxID=64838 RepID=A0A9R1SXV1_9HYME|nr:PREDICTED: transcription factor che-1-like isoform X2 [Fopius arisanus]